MKIENVEEIVEDCRRKRPRLPGWLAADAFLWADKRRLDPDASPEERQRAADAVLAIVELSMRRLGVDISVDKSN